MVRVAGAVGEIELELDGQVGLLGHARDQRLERGLDTELVQRRGAQVRDQ